MAFFAVDSVVAGFARIQPFVLWAEFSRIQLRSKGSAPTTISNWAARRAGSVLPARDKIRSGRRRRQAPFDLLEWTVPCNRRGIKHEGSRVSPDDAVVVFQPLRAATTPPAAAVPVRNALRVRSVSDLGLLPAEQSRSSITAHLLFLPPNDRRSAARRAPRGTCPTAVELAPCQLQRPGSARRDAGGSTCLVR